MTVYYWIFGVAIVVALLLWWQWSRWLWDNIFGVVLVSSTAFTIAPLRTKVADPAGVQMDEGPRSALLAVLVVLHLLTVNMAHWREVAKAEREAMEELVDDVMKQEEAWHRGEVLPDEGVTFVGELQDVSHLVRRPLLSVGCFVLWR